MDTEVILSIWQFFEPDYSATKRKERAYEFLRMMQDQEVDIDFDLLKGSSNALDLAIEQIHHEDDEIEEEAEEDYE